jgi:hypothetical protein
MNGIADLYKLADVSAGQPSPMMLFPIGDWTSAKYPNLSLTQDLADEVLANFESEVLRTKVPVEMTGVHSEALAPAAGWVDRVYQAPFEWQGVAGEALYADWTPNARGAEVVNDGQYAYDSIDLSTHIDPVSKSSTPNVLKAVALTNRPVLRMMPSVKDAGDSIKLGEPIELQLSEFTLADAPAPDPVVELCDKVDSLLAELSTALKGKAGIPAIRTMMREVSTKARAHTLSEDPDGNPVVPESASSDGSSHPAKADEGHPITLDEGDPVPKGSDPMKSVALKLNLSEDADEALVLAEVVKLSDERDTAVAKLAEVEKAKRDAEVTAKLSELIDGGHVLPGQKDTWLKLAEDSPASFDAMAEQAKHAKSIELGETGDGAKPESDLTPDEQLDAKAREIAKTRNVGLAEATDLALSENPELKDAYTAAIGQ